MPPSAAAFLFKLAEKIRQNTAMLAELESRNSGKPIVEAEFDIADVATCFEYYGGLANKVLGPCESGARQCAQFYVARACRRCGANYSLEFSVADGRVETGAGAGGGLLRACSSPRSKLR